jgi:hypothetical protein
MLGSRSLALAIALCATIAHPSPAQSCDLVVAALSALKADSSNAVLVDHTVMGIPLFAFDGYSGSRRGDTALARIAEPPLRELNKTRVPLPDCLRAHGAWTVVPDSELVALFTKSDDGWAAFHKRYPDRSQFALVSQPIVAGDTATIFVAVASGRLAGRGIVVRLIRDPTGRWVKQSDVQLWIS